MNEWIDGKKKRKKEKWKERKQEEEEFSIKIFHTATAFAVVGCPMHFPPSGQSVCWVSLSSSGGLCNASGVAEQNSSS